MDEFTRFTCWSVESAQQTISTEAVSPSRGVFLATHAPLAIRRRALVDGGSSGRGSYVTEADVLADFVSRATNNGVLLLPVIGQSGTGKSHLVRWIHEKLEASPQMKVIYLPKTATSLADVVSRLLLGSEGEEFDDLRRSSEGLDTNFSQEQLERRLLDSLAEALVRAAPKTPSERALVGDVRGLYLLMHDPFFRGHLLRPGALVPRRAKHLLEGKGQDESEIPLEFRLEDLPLDVTDVTHASAASQKIYRVLAANAGLQDAAVRLLNDNLDIAVMEAANLGIGRLQRAMLRIREILQARGEEIILLIEDFALIQGVQRDLLDAITETGVKDGQAIYAPIRTIMAVTSGYFDRLEDTVRTRVAASVPHAYDLDIQFGEDVSDAAISDFVGRYLNAARTGRHALELGERNGSVPNACGACRFEDVCHTSFGTSTEGFGLYPFNASALIRSVRSRTSNGQGRAFNPRTALGGVLRHVLVEFHDEIESGDFPSTRFREDFPTSNHVSGLSTSVQTQIEELDHEEPDRRKLLLEFWGNGPNELTNLARGIHQAFTLSQLDVETTNPNPPPPAPGLVDEPDSPVPNALQKKLQVVEDWASRGGALPQDIEARIRIIVRAAVIEQARWTDPLAKEPAVAVLDRAWPKTNSLTILIEGSRGADQLGEGHKALIEFKRNGTNAQFFQDLLRVNEGIDGVSVESLARLDHLAQQHAAALQQMVVRERSAEESQLQAAVEVSFRGAMIAGRLGLKPSTDDILSAVFDDGIGWRRADANLRIPAWQAQSARHLQERPAFISDLRDRVGISQGKTGRVQAIDAARVLPLVRRIAKNQLSEWSQESIPLWARKAAASIRTIEATVDDQLRSLETMASSIRTMFHQGETLSEVVAALNGAYTAAVPGGLLAAAPDLIENDISRLSKVDGASITRLERDLSTARDDPSAAFSVACVDRGMDLIELESALGRSSGWLHNGLDRARQGLGGSGSSATSDLEHLLNDWRALAKGVSDA
ncbi:hypothetical protein C6I20_08020 [Aeromicrobium sp. A1-2]|uniref:protein DpdH n=1 Tax=Aeromicrobium sp. A1-2 TaxID=2107713 RepID=UPI000E4BB659|nr:protein DpdH [Aeromicrobium sp. A1-2]AXT85133.1 hypothetical protein C6I20_08020 [Aeromicrobium sp. A1-2]